MEERDSSFIWKIVLVIFLLILVGIIFYFVGKNSVSSTKCSECQDCANWVGEKDPKTHQLGNSGGSNYRIFAVDNNMGVSVLSNSDRKSITVAINRDGVRNYFNIDVGSNSEFVKTFNKEIRQIFIGYFGQAAGQECILLIMADGTVEYIPIVKELKNPNWRNMSDSEKFNSRGAINGLTDVVGFLYLQVDNTSGYYSVGAIRKDGTFYDLMEFVPNMDL